jgi:hypothetical protein
LVSAFQRHWWSVAMSYDMTYDVGQRLPTSLMKRCNVIWHDLWCWSAPSNVTDEALQCHMTWLMMLVSAFQRHWWSVAMSYDMTYDIGVRPKSHVWCHADVIWMSYDVGQRLPKSLMKRCNVIWHDLWCWCAPKKSCMMSCWCHMNVIWHHIWCWGRPRSSPSQNPIENQYKNNRKLIEIDGDDADPTHRGGGKCHVMWPQHDIIWMSYDVGQRLQSHWWSVAMSYDMTYDVGVRPKSHVWCHADVIWMSYDIGRPPQMAKIMSYDINMTSCWHHMTLGGPPKCHIWCHHDIIWHHIWHWPAPMSCHMTSSWHHHDMTLRLYRLIRKWL